MQGSASGVTADVPERAPITAANGSWRHDAFISYSHAADGKLAPALRNALQRFGTPWGPFRWTNPVRSLRIFQDQASLAANPALWPTIEHGLGSAEWFILLASPQSAQSPWVEKEVDFWCRTKRPERLLIVQTDGDIAWDHDSNDFDWTKTTALPRRLSTVFMDEPRWINARWARTGAHATLRDPRFRDLVAELAAPLRGIAKDELIGEDIRQHRRLNRWRNAAVGVLTTLLIGAVAAAAIAVSQRDQARHNQMRALAALANVEADTGSPATAIRIALAAVPPSLEGTGSPFLHEAWDSLYLSLGQVQELRRFVGHELPVFSVAFSPDGRTVVTGSGDKTARLLEVAAGKEIATLRGHEGSVKSAAFSPDGRTVITGSTDKTARLWEVPTGKEIMVLRGHEGAVWSVAFSPDGRTVATGSQDKTARLWDVATGEKIVGLTGHEYGVWSVAFSPDGRTVVTGDGGGNVGVWEWAARKGTPLLRILDPVHSVAFSPDGRMLVIGTESGTVGLWEVATGKHIAELRGHEGAVWSVSFSPDGETVATGSRDTTARLWKVLTSPDAPPEEWAQVTHKATAVLRGHGGAVWSAAFSPDGRTVLTGSQDKTARLWQVASGKEITVLRGHEDRDGLFLSAFLSASSAAASSAAFSPDGSTVVTGSEDRTARLWDVATGKEIMVLRGHEGGVLSVAFSPDGRSLATGSWDKTARLWDVATGKEIMVLRGHEDGVPSVAFSPDGRSLATGSWDKTARLWDVATGKEMLVLHGHDDRIMSVAFSPDGRTVVTGSDDRTARLWEVPTGNEVAVLRDNELSVLSAAFSPDGRTLATGSQDTTARLWEVATGKQIATLRAHEDGVTSIAFSPDGRTVVTGSSDRTARLWDVATGKEIGVLRGHDGGIRSVAFSFDGRTLATSSDDNTARLWPVGQGLIDLACARVHDLPLSQNDKQRFGIENEWCTPEVSAAPRAKLGLDKPEASSTANAAVR